MSPWQALISPAAPAANSDLPRRVHVLADDAEPLPRVRRKKPQAEKRNTISVDEWRRTLPKSESYR